MFTHKLYMLRAHRSVWTYFIPNILSPLLLKSKNRHWEVEKIKSLWFFSDNIARRPILFVKELGGLSSFIGILKFKNVYGINTVESFNPSISEWSITKVAVNLVGKWFSSKIIIMLLNRFLCSMWTWYPCLGSQILLLIII